MPPKLEGEARPSVMRRRAEKRRVRVAQMLVRRWEPTEIAEALGVSERTIGYDIKILRLRGRKEVKRTIVADVAAGLVAQQSARERELWRLATLARPGKDDNGKEVAGDPALMMNLLRELRQSGEGMTKALQSLGVVYKEPVGVSLEVQLVSSLQAMSDDDVARLARASDDELVAAMAALGQEKAVGLLASGDPDDIDEAEYEIEDDDEPE